MQTSSDAAREGIAHGGHPWRRPARKAELDPVARTPQVRCQRSSSVDGRSGWSASNWLGLSIPMLECRAVSPNSSRRPSSPAAPTAATTCSVASRDSAPPPHRAGKTPIPPPLRPVADAVPPGKLVPLRGSALDHEVAGEPTAHASRLAGPELAGFGLGGPEARPGGEQVRPRKDRTNRPCSPPRAAISTYRSTRLFSVLPPTRLLRGCSSAGPPPGLSDHEELWPLAINWATSAAQLQARLTPAPPCP